MSEGHKNICESSRLRAIQDKQGKIYIAERTDFGYLTVEGTPLPIYGYTDLGLILEAYNKLAQYRHAARILTSSVAVNFNNVINLFREIEK